MFQGYEDSYPSCDTTSVVTSFSVKDILSTSLSNDVNEFYVKKESFDSGQHHQCWDSPYYGPSDPNASCYYNGEDLFSRTTWGDCGGYNDVSCSNNTTSVYGDMYHENQQSEVDLEDRDDNPSMFLTAFYFINCRLKCHLLILNNIFLLIYCHCKQALYYVQTSF